MPSAPERQVIGGQIVEQRDLPSHGRLRLVRRRAVPQAAVMGADVADVADAPHPCCQKLSPGQAVLTGNHCLIGDLQAGEEM
jgi:hypothetical protein